MNDMTKVIEPRSDQWNADDFLSGPRTFTIRDVQIRGGQEQPVNMLLEGTDKAYRPCKSMSRCLVAAWGADARAYVGRSMTLYTDPKVKWGGMEVGGIRISHLSHINGEMVLALTATKGQRKPHRVMPLKDAPGNRPGNDQAATKQSATISFTTPIGEAREFPRNLGGIEQYVEAFAAAFGEATDKGAWFAGNKALFHELAIGAVGSRGKSERCEKLAARFDAVSAEIEAALAKAAEG